MSTENEETPPTIQGATSAPAQLSEPMRILEALLFASDEVLTPARIKTILPGQPDGREIRKMVQDINSLLQKQRHPFEIIEVAGGYQLRTIAYYSTWVRQLFKEKAAKRLSMQALECLAIIAYKQPITKAEIEAIRGVVSDGAMKTLFERHLVTIAGRSEKAGRPLLYATTKEFLTYFGLRNLEDLPKLDEFEALAREKMGDLETQLDQAAEEFPLHGDQGEGHEVSPEQQPSATISEETTQQQTEEPPPFQVIGMSEDPPPEQSPSDTSEPPAA